MTTIQLRARRPSGPTVDTSLVDVNPLRESFSRFASGGTLRFQDSDGTKASDYPYGTRVEVQYSTDGGSTYTTRLTGFVVDTNRTMRGGLPLVDVDIVAYDHLLRRRKVYKSYSSSTISTILEDLVTSFTAVSWVAGNVSVTNDKTLSREFKGTRVDEAIAYLASESADEEWGVNDSLEFYFQGQDDSRAAAIGDGDVITHDLPERGKRAINRFKLFYGPSGSRNAVVVEDRESQQDLKDKLSAPRGVKVSDSDTFPEITDEDRAEALARQQLDSHSLVQTGTVTVPLGRFDTSAGDVFELTISDAGISSVDYRVAQVEYRWQSLETVLTVAENSASNMEDLLVGLSDSVDNVRAREADPSVTPTNFLDLQSGVTLSISTTLTTKQASSDTKTWGQSQWGQGSGDQWGSGIATSSSVSEESAKVSKAALNLLRDVWQDGQSAWIDHTHLGAGTDNTAATRSDSSLQAPVGRVELEKFGTGSTSTEYEFVASVPAGGVYGDAGSLAELMVFDAASGGNGYLRVTHANASLDASTRLQVHVEVSISDDTGEQGVITDTGQQRLRDLYVGESGHEPTDMVYGTGTTAAATSDSSLESKSHEDTIDSTADRSTGITDIVERITASDADTTNVSELGYENSSDELEARVTFEAYDSDLVVEANYRFKASNA